MRALSRITMLALVALSLSGCLEVGQTILDQITSEVARNRAAQVKAE